MWTLLMIRDVGSAGEHYDDNDSDDKDSDDNDSDDNDSDDNDSDDNDNDDHVDSAYHQGRWQCR